MAMWPLQFVGLMRMYRATTGGLNTWRTMESRSELAGNSFDMENYDKKETNKAREPHDIHETDKVESTEFSTLV